ncbi:MAG: chloride channel protein [SAR324 cluster bacterium]|nr:chloride channel protein [SAR324 cluster bacterium]
MSRNLKKYWKKTTKLLPSGLTENYDPLLSRFHQITAREIVVMMFGALVVGIGCGMLAVGLNWSVHHLQEELRSLPPGLWTILFPAIGAGSAVFFIRFILKDDGGHGVPEVIRSVSLGSGKLPKRMIGSRFVGSLLTVGFGGSAGLEGPIVCIGGAYAALVGRWFDLNERRRKLLVGYGTAGAVAGIFNAPITGVFFALEIVLGEWSLLTILPTIIAATSATELSRMMVGNKIAFYHDIVGFSFFSLCACVILGFLTGTASVMFNRSLSMWEKFFEKLSKITWIRAALGGVGVGVLGFLMPEVLSEGYETTQNFLINPAQQTLQFVFLFLLLKFVACGITVGSGGVGGVFAPSLVIGSSIGMAFGMLLHLLPFGGIADAEAFSLSAMAGMVTGVMQGPLTGIFLIMESTGGYSLILPLMLTASSSMLTSHLMDVGSVYTRSLIKTGDLARPGSDAYLLHHLNIRDIMDTDCISISESLLLGDFIEVFKKSHRNYFPVLSAEGQQCVGVVFLDDIRPYLFQDYLYDLLAMGTVMRMVPQISPSQSVDSALKTFEQANAWSLPVVENEKFIGMLSKSTLFDHYRREFLVQ